MEETQTLCGIISRLQGTWFMLWFMLCYMLRCMLCTLPEQDTPAVLMFSRQSDSRKRSIFFFIHRSRTGSNKELSHCYDFKDLTSCLTRLTSCS